LCYSVKEKTAVWAIVECLILNEMWTMVLQLINIHEHCYLFSTGKQVGSVKMIYRRLKLCTTEIPSLLGSDLALFEFTYTWQSSWLFYLIVAGWDNVSGFNNDQCT
jgi:hypothetical protein